ncbi:hypothetical protein BZG36_02273 [Bifiguratus adelaidae]|uniref:Calpain catalytic domain-containing protein n=1 Tax=Bifiguratus adelaidae TaxID=1938954 RepID=A0A261XY72_9FUNG|nr:hypothetical protein BZG36_02273 [Bifiguratus adelaidae]
MSSQGGVGSPSEGSDSSLGNLYRSAFQLASKAVQLDGGGQAREARQRYMQVNEVCLSLVSGMKRDNTNASQAILSDTTWNEHTVDQNEAQRKRVMAKLTEYTHRVEQINSHLKDHSDTLGRQPSQERQEIAISAQARSITKTDADDLMEKAKFILSQAQLHDSKQNLEFAFDLYRDAAELFLKAHSVGSSDEGSRNEIKAQALAALTRAEQLNNLPKEQLLNKKMSHLSVTPTTPPLRSPTINPLTFVDASSEAPRLSSAEISLLRETSNVNGKVYLPWMDVDLKERFDFDKQYRDPDGFLALSPKQTAIFGAWKRPSDIMRKPEMIELVSSTSIVQDIVTDCSFVASLCVSAAYENRFKKQLITACIFPQDKMGQPLYNPNGKYMVKLHYNGIPRKVGKHSIDTLNVIDDYLPVSKDGKLMCTFSTNTEELWASIIEKAYMKLMGGYDFPGSNSGIDLHTLTGWIPEHIFINDKGFNKENVWKRIVDGQKYGDALITISTGKMTDEEADSLGLVATHAYAVLDVREVLGKRLLEVKNPWNHKRWKGPFSHLDNDGWTEELKSALRFDPKSVAHRDDGMFWIDFDSVCAEFDSIHMNWNPELFKHRWVIHYPWPSNLGPKKDLYNLGYNPQFRLEVEVKGNQASAVWLLLTKHITKKEENRDYITIYVYKDTKGEKVYYPGKAMKEGTYVNSPHILMRFNASPGTSWYTIVVSQHEKSRTLNFSLRAFSTSKFKLGEVPRKYIYEQKIAGQWTELTAGGNTTNATFTNNPEWKLTIPESSAQADVLLMLEAPRAFAVHAVLLRGGNRVSNVSFTDIISQSGDYRHGFAYCEALNLKAGEYTIIASTYEAGLLGQFFLTVASTVNFTCISLPLEGAGMYKQTIRDAWVGGLNAMGCRRNYHLNPQYFIDVTEQTTIKIRLQTPAIDPIPNTNVTVYERHPTQPLGKEVATSGPYTNLIQGVVTTEKVLLPNERGYTAIFATWEAGISGSFIAYVYTDRPVKVYKAPVATKY